MIDLNLLTKYRLQLMGISILLVMYYHTPVDVSHNPVLHILREYGYICVDIFVFLTGIGIYFSFLKEGSILNFYKRKAFRILPYYLPLVFALSLFYYTRGIIDLKLFICNIFMLSYWLQLPGMFDWYIPTLFGFYLFGPFFVKFYLKNKVLSFSIVMLLCIAFAIVVGGTRFCFYLLNILRVPALIMGIAVGDYLKNNKGNTILKPKTVMLLAAAMVIGYVVLTYFFQVYPDKMYGYGLFFYPNWLITLPLCLLLSYIMSLAKNYKYPVLTFLGTYTLTLYLFHDKLLSLSLLFTGQYHVVLATVLTFVCAFLWKKLVDWIMDKYFS